MQDEFGGPRVDAIIERAAVHAHALHHEYIGTEHLLLGLMDVREPELDRLMSRLRLEGGSLVRYTLDEVRPGRADVSPGSARPPFTSRAKKVLAIATQVAATFGAAQVRAADVLVALAVEGRGIASQALAAHNVDGLYAGTTLADVREIALSSDAVTLFSDSARPPRPGAPDRPQRTPWLEATLRELPPDFAGVTGLTVIADLSVVDADTVVELLAALDMLHRAWGGAGLVLESQTVGSTVQEGVAA